MKRQRVAVKRVEEMSASHGRPLVPDTRCDGNCGTCRACQDDVFFDQVCDEVEGTYKDKSRQ